MRFRCTDGWWNAESQQSRLAGANSNTTHTMGNLTGPTPPASDVDSLPTAPAPYHDRKKEWFQPGRLFKVWAPHEEHIHQQEFLLLDTRNTHGPCLAVHIFTEEELEEETESFHSTHALLQNFDSVTPEPSHHKTFRLIEREKEMRVPARCYLETEYNYDIPYSFACEYRGMLHRPDLKKVRKWYVEWLKEEWDLDT